MESPRVDGMDFADLIDGFSQELELLAVESGEGHTGPEAGAGGGECL